MTAAKSTSQPPPARKGGLRFWALGGVTLAALAAVAAVGAWWWHLPAVEPPPAPDIPDAEVRLVTDRARQKVLDNPRDARAWGGLGTVFLAHMFEREADQCFAQAARLDPTDARWPYGRATIALKRDPEHAVAYLRQAAACADFWPEGHSAARLQLAQALLARRELDEAGSLFQDELRRDPRSARATFGLGLVAVARGNDRTAVEYLNAVRANPYARKKAAAQLAALAGARGDAAAEVEFEKQAADLPEDPPWPDPFVDMLRDARAGPRYWERKLEALEAAHNFKDAADIYLGQIRDQPTARAYLGAGTNLARLGDYARALPLLREGIQRDPDNAQAHYDLALVQYKRALEERPGSEPAKEWLREAVEHAKKTTELKADHAWAFSVWGMALKLLGEPAKAVEPLRRGIACRPEMFDLQLTLGEVLMETGHNGEAETYLENARRLQPNNEKVLKDLERLRAKKE
jgi:tetratricopeptide (TPR) repeat protein